MTQPPSFTTDPDFTRFMADAEAHWHPTKLARMKILVDYLTRKPPTPPLDGKGALSHIKAHDYSQPVALVELTTGMWLVSFRAWVAAPPPGEEYRQFGSYYTFPDRDPGRSGISTQGKQTCYYQVVTPVQAVLSRIISIRTKFAGSPVVDAAGGNEQLYTTEAMRGLRALGPGPQHRTRHIRARVLRQV